MAMSDGRPKTPWIAGLGGGRGTGLPVGNADKSSPTLPHPGKIGGGNWMPREGGMASPAPPFPECGRGSPHGKANRRAYAPADGGQREKVTAPGSCWTGSWRWRLNGRGGCPRSGRHGNRDPEFSSGSRLQGSNCTSIPVVVGGRIFIRLPATPILRSTSPYRGRSRANPCGCPLREGWGVAERTGFEPVEPLSGFTGLANQRNRPLCHLSVP